jgi:hypothetical protein
MAVTTFVATITYNKLSPNKAQQMEKQEKIAMKKALEHYCQLKGNQA